MQTIRRFLNLLPGITMLGPALATLGAHASPAIEIRVGMGLAKPPYVFENGKEGLDVEIAQQALAAGGYKMVGLQYPAARALRLLLIGQVDGLLSVDEGISSIGHAGHFSDTYIVYQNVATTLARRHISLARVEDLARYSVAAYQNASLTLGEQFKAVATRHADYHEYAQQVTQSKLLYSGRVEVVVCDRLIFRYFSTRLEPTIDTTQPVTFHAIFPPSPRKAVFRDSEVRDRFNAGLKTIRRNGIYDAILKKYQAYMQP